jgi:Ser/Thr protein kinase RdoA (MazF antagonist)
VESPERAAATPELVLRAFAVTGEFLDAVPYGRGHIHRSFVARHRRAGRLTRVLLQRVNTRVFRDPEALMENLGRVTAHLRRAVQQRGLPEPERRALELVSTRGGAAWHRDASGGIWRAFRFIEGTRSAERLAGPDQAFSTGRAFGDFVEMLADLPPPPLREPLPHFHDLRRRGLAFERAAAADLHGRAADVAEDVAAVREEMARAEPELEDLRARPLPRRVLHHDCKLNNLLLDERTGEPVCVVDLDTVMEGTIVSDFGELVRSGVCPAPEDAGSVQPVEPDLALFEGLVRGFLAALAGRLAPREVEALPGAGALLALMNATRFLTDHLEGDVYFRVERPAQNLERARAQLRLARALRREERSLRELVDRAARDAAQPSSRPAGRNTSS